jgi:spore coat protein CotH
MSNNGGSDGAGSLQQDTAQPTDTGPASPSWQTDADVEWAGGGGGTTTLFDAEAIHEIEVELGSSARTQLERDPTRYVEGRFIWDGLDIPVGVRLKGSSSLDSFRGKPSLKIDFNLVVDGLTVQGQKKLNIHNMRYDPMKVSEELVYRMWREADLPASRTSYARIRIDGDDYGLYSLVEVPDDPLLERWFDDPDGNLYENAANYCDLDDGRRCFDAEEDDEGNNDALDRLIAAATTADGTMAALTEQLDWDRYTGFLAMEAATAHWDSYSFDQSNYRWYHEPTADTWSLIPSSTDLGFGYRPWSYPDCGLHGTDPGNYTMGIVSERCWRDADCEEAVLDKMLLAADRMEAMDAPTALRQATDRVRDAVYDDNRKSTSNSHFEEHIDCVESWLAQRPDEVRDWVATRRAD